MAWIGLWDNESTKDINQKTEKMFIIQQINKMGDRLSK